MWDPILIFHLTLIKYEYVSEDKSRLLLTAELSTAFKYCSWSSANGGCASVLVVIGIWSLCQVWGAGGTRSTCSSSAYLRRRGRTTPITTRYTHGDLRKAVGIMGHGWDRCDIPVLKLWHCLCTTAYFCFYHRSTAPLPCSYILVEKAGMLRLWLLSLAVRLQLEWSQLSVSASFVLVFVLCACLRVCMFVSMFFCMYCTYSAENYLQAVPQWTILPVQRNPLRVLSKCDIKGRHTLPQFAYFNVFCFVLFVSAPHRKLSQGGVSLLKPEPRHRGSADSVLSSIRTLPCHVIRYGWARAPSAAMRLRR